MYDAESDREFALKKSEPEKEDLTPPAAPATLSVPERVAEPVPPADTHCAQENDVRLNTPSPGRGGGWGVGSFFPGQIRFRSIPDIARLWFLV